MNSKWILSLAAMAATSYSLAAERVDLAHLTPDRLSTFRQTVIPDLPVNFRTVRKHVDHHQMTHLRIQQTVGGYPVWGADAILHVPATIRHTDFATLLIQTGTDIHMNGTAWRSLAADLREPPAKWFDDTHASAVMQQAEARYEKQTGSLSRVRDRLLKKIVFVDTQQRAHWAWHIEFTTGGNTQPLARPAFLIDAITGKVYQQWDNLKTLQVVGGGLGGNPQTGQVIYDGLATHLPALQMSRHADTQLCLLQNSEVTIVDRDAVRGDSVSRFPCPTKDKLHNQLYWNGTLMAANGAFSPDNDALFIGHVIQQLYHDWYGVPALTHKGKPMNLIMRVHDYEMPENAFWDGHQMTFGDGGEDYYPFTILSIGAHEVSHGFTEQHSDLIYTDESGGLNESFSDMAGSAADYYVYGKTTWGVGAEISKTGEGPFRFMDQPSKDCYGRLPGHRCSIDKASQYHCTKDQEGNRYCLDVHYSSGVFNRAFYLLATTPHWDIHKAFDVMVKANQDYWVPSTTFQQAACGVMSAAKDLQYDTKAVSNALKEVDLDVKSC